MDSPWPRAPAAANSMVTTWPQVWPHFSPLSAPSVAGIWEHFMLYAPSLSLIKSNLHIHPSLTWTAYIVDNKAGGHPPIKLPLLFYWGSPSPWLGSHSHSPVCSTDSSSYTWSGTREEPPRFRSYPIPTPPRPSPSETNHSGGYSDTYSLRWTATPHSYPYFPRRFCHPFPKLSSCHLQPSGQDTASIPHPLPTSVFSGYSWLVPTNCPDHRLALLLSRCTEAFLWDQTSNLQTC